MNKKLLIGLIISAGLVYLSVKNINSQDVISRFHLINLNYLPPAIITLFLVQTVRTIRWGIILRPLVKISYLNLFSIASVGFLSIVALPARLGELVRPYLIHKGNPVRFSSALATIFVERALDSATVLIMAGVVLFFAPLPLWLITSGIIFGIITFLLLALIIFLIAFRESALSFLAPVINLLPYRYAQKIKEIIHNFIDGFQIILQEKRLLHVAVLTIIIWLLNVLIIYLLFLAFSFALPLTASFILNLVLILGIAIPSGPGFIGNWHYFTILGLGLFGISQAEALSFAIIHHFLSLGVVIILGLIFLPSHTLSLTDIKRQTQNKH